MLVFCAQEICVFRKATEEYILSECAGVEGIHRIYPTQANGGKVPLFDFKMLSFFVDGNQLSFGGG